MKVILVPVADRPECRVALDQAFHLADELAANVVGCHLRLHRSVAPAKRRPHYHLHGGRHQQEPGSAPVHAAVSASKAAQGLFAERVEAHAFTQVKRARVGMERCARWFEMVGALDRLFSIAGPVADLSVLSRPPGNARGHGSDFLLSALLHSGRPVLILPPKATARPGRRVLIAWNQGLEAARAVSAALPLLQRAEAVHIFSAGPEDQAGPKAVNLADYLKSWGVKSRCSMSKGKDKASELEAAYKETRSDLIVMGAYSHSRMREIIFGGITQHMLYRTSYPVFALHH